jgi:hypothetical protein
MSRSPHGDRIHPVDYVDLTPSASAWDRHVLFRRLSDLKDACLHNFRAFVKYATARIEDVVVSVPPAQLPQAFEELSSELEQPFSMVRMSCNLTVMV